MKFLCAEKISQHKFKTPEGYLVCVDSVLARTGKQTYKRSELFGCDCKDAENEVDVDRPAEEVFSDATLASFENKPLTIEHPDEDVNTSNHRDLAVGFARDIKRGKDNGQDVMLGTLVFTDEDAIEAIESGEMVELSCGYDADIVDENNPCQRNIRGNHIALCQRGRAGNARIVDSKISDSKWYDPEYSKYVTEDYIKRQYENFKKSPYFKQTYEKFREENFIEVKPGMERYFDSFDDSIDDAGLHQEQLAQSEYDKAKKRLNYLYEQRRKATSSNYSGIHFESEIAELEKKIAKLKKDFGYALGDSNMKDTDFSKQSKQGYQVVEMYRDAGRLHAILKRSNDYVIAYGYDTSDGTWAQGRYDFSTLDRARQALQEEKKYARKIADVDTYEEATENLKTEAKKAMNDEWSGSFDGYIFSYNSKDDTYLITSPSGKEYRVRADKLTPQDAIKKVKLLKDSKEDILQKIRNTSVKEGEMFEMRDGQWLVQIQNTGAQEISTRSGPFKSTGNASLRMSVKLSSHAWGRIWKNGTIVFNETNSLNVVRDKMIQFLKTVRDSKE